MNWYEIRIITTHEASDAVSEILISLGAAGTYIEDPADLITCKDDENNWDYIDEKLLQITDPRVTIRAYFPDNTNIPELICAVQEKLTFASSFLDIGEGKVETSVLNEEDWANNWKKYYKPFAITPGIIIKPTWENYEAENNSKKIIEMDPGMAFGTGTHETTRLCAGFIEKYVKEGDTAIDVGCGTGILSIIAMLCGAKKVTAIDIDSVAVKSTEINTALNHFEDKIEVLKGILTDLPQVKADIIFANIVANVIIDISVNIPYYLKTGGFIILSGIINDRVDDVLSTYTNMGFELFDRVHEGEWAALVFKNV